MSYHADISALIAAIVPFDSIEASTRAAALAWVESGGPLCRTEKPATPPQHLVSYFVVIDADYVLLVDHINAGLWLPTGGHVEPGEHPRTTAQREAREELGIDARFVLPTPLFITSAETVGRTAGHTDISLWYVLRGSRAAELRLDLTEFREARWFHRTAVPLAASDPHFGRFLTKFYGPRVQAR